MPRHTTYEYLIQLEDLDKRFLNTYNTTIGKYNKIAIKHNHYLHARNSESAFFVTSLDIKILKKMEFISSEYNKILKKLIHYTAAHETEEFKHSPTCIALQKDYKEHDKILHKITKIKHDIMKSFKKKKENKNSKLHDTAEYLNSFFKDIQEKRNELLSDYTKIISEYNDVIEKYNEYAKRVSKDNLKSTVYPLTESEMHILESMRTICHGYIHVFNRHSKIVARHHIQRSDAEQIASDCKEAERILETIQTCIYNWSGLSLNKQFLPQFTNAILTEKTSSIPNAGQGAFVASGHIQTGEIIAPYPGIPVPESSNLYNRKSHYLYGFQIGDDCIENGFMIDADPKFLNKISKEMGIEPPLGSDKPIHRANMALDLEDSMASFRPIFLPSKMPCSLIPCGQAQPYVLPSIVAVADKDIAEGQEILMDYGDDSREVFKKRCGA